MDDQSDHQSTKSRLSHPYRARLPGFIAEEDLGLGDVIKHVTYRIGIATCGGCRQRAAALNRWLVFTSGSKTR